MLVDSWAWIEFFKKSPNCVKIKERIRNARLFTSVLSLAEICFWCKRNGVDSGKYAEEIKNNSTILPVWEETAEQAGKALQELRKTASGIGMIDAILYVQAANAGVKLLTGDPHFRKLPNVEFVE